MKSIVRVLTAISWALLLMPAGAMAADILELLKTHQIVGGDVCIDEGSKPCNPPPMNARSELRLVNGLLISRSLVTKTGSIYPLNREEDILAHPLVKDFYRRQSVKNHYVKAQATVSGDTLVLTRKQGFEQGFGENPRSLIHSISVATITIRGMSCDAVLDYSSSGWTVSPGAFTTQRKRFRCELAPLETSSEMSAGSKLRTLSFTRLERYFAGVRSRQTYDFTLLNDRLHFKVVYCSDNSQLTVQFDWRGGALKGTHRCETETNDRINQHTLSYSSLTKIDGNARHFTASGTHERKEGYAGFSRSFEFDIRVALDGGKCRLEKFRLKENFNPNNPVPSPAFYDADSESECSLN